VDGACCDDPHAGHRCDRDDGRGHRRHLPRGRPPDEGTWLASWRLQVQDASGQQDTDNGDGMFVDAPESSTALFEARGSPSTNNFKVLFVGRVAT
jgi:hypothetical protein